MPKGYILVDSGVTEGRKEDFESWFGSGSVYAPRYKFTKEKGGIYSLWIDRGDTGWFEAVYKKFLEDIN